MKILDRYLLRQIAGPFLLGVVAFVMVFVSANILFKLTELVSELGLSIWVAGELFFLWLPGFIVLTFPLATLMAILIVFGRLSGDSELVAMFAGGMSFRRMVVPIVLFGLLVSLLTSGLNEYVAPAAQRCVDAIVREATLRVGKVDEEQGVVQREVVNGNGRVVIAESLNVATQEMTNPIIIEYTDNKVAEIITAKRARWVGKDWVLYDGATVSKGVTPYRSEYLRGRDCEFQSQPAADGGGDARSECDDASGTEAVHRERRRRSSSLQPSGRWLFIRRSRCPSRAWCSRC